MVAQFVGWGRLGVKMMVGTHSDLRFRVSKHPNNHPKQTDVLR